MQQIYQKKITTFEKLLEKVNVAAISEHVYCRNYLQHLIIHRKYYLKIYEHIFSLLLKKSGKNISEITLIDFGCGNGLLGIFLKFCGINRVMLMDSDPLFIEAAKQLSKTLHVAVDEFLNGDESILFSISKPDIIVGTDVIEHVYDLNALMTMFHQLNPNLVSLFTTGSNPANKRKVKKLMELQKKDEWEGGVTAEGDLGHAPHIAFLEMRKHIIQNFQLNLTESEINTLAVLTRGLNKKDIRKKVEFYREKQQFPATPVHPTNTCDPNTGSWTERILTITEYKNIYNKNGFYLDLYAGFYNQFFKGLKSHFAKLMNSIIKFTGIRFAPFIILIGIKKYDE